MHQASWEQLSISNLMDVGSHFGHKRQFWNPKMLSYIYGANKQNDMHIINLAKSLPIWKEALKKIMDISAKSGRVLFVGTKPQASQLIKEAAVYCGQHYVNLRWPSGMLTNWYNISAVIKRYVESEKAVNITKLENSNFTKKEILVAQRKNKRSEKLFGGVKNMGGLPNIIFVIDSNKESIAIKEAKALGIPVVAIVDTNCDPSNITYPIPGNDDSIKAIKYYCGLVASAVLSGIELDLKGSAKEEKSDDFSGKKGRFDKENRENRPRKGVKEDYEDSGKR